MCVFLFVLRLFLDRLNERFIDLILTSETILTSTKLMKVEVEEVWMPPEQPQFGHVWIFDVWQT